MYVMVQLPGALSLYICACTAAGFSLEEGRNLLAQWLKVKPEQLSSYADQILEFCR